MHISIELIPRDLDGFREELQTIKTRHTPIDTVNVPDLMRLSVRSWEGTAAAKSFYERAIPHIRAIDFDLREPFKLGSELVDKQLTEILVVAGDPPTDMMRKVYPTKTAELIRKVKQEYPQLKVYAAIDPYRSSIREEIGYVGEKLEAGADGFFTQPFLDVRLMEVYAELLPGCEIYWGVSPVMTDASRGYWETKNNAVFPGNFKPTLDWNVDFARRAIDCAGTVGGHIYLMPIKVDLEAYLSGIFN
ncbi:methylenetetrahydrofolate reductase [Paenibacillus darwinianus]|uniref:Methylenetetrahydrofolate reductase n=1 Tax=Paenibacillus darwinianus TaxID=1380763 RepID=A0A9W5S274_9BACL|nr:methylenetetrahydrofolate reductase [Paenibacillus darwinianus]EXX85899.1 methylenetetrahydrofolate reductase [Paenibacillus darwinianus]EXX88129.1 methylenetetrahydrofolate reductase [Paenibacillus darwinianus]EXX88730.1 methylenetetrahydrofolate reductase [Paenibacillus darwinianus]